MLCAVKKCMGLRPGEKLERLGMIRVISARLERLADISMDDVRREGFPFWAPPKFVEFFCEGHKGCTPESVVTRIEFEKI